MLNIFGFLVPGIIAVQITERLGAKLSRHQYIADVLIFNFLIILLNYLVLTVIGYGDIVINFDTCAINFTAKYWAMSLIWTFILPFIQMKVLSKFTVKIDE